MASYSHDTSDSGRNWLWRNDHIPLSVGRRGADFERELDTDGVWPGCGSEPYTNFGIEPAMVPYDCINRAIENDAVSWLEPGAERSWSISVELQA